MEGQSPHRSTGTEAPRGLHPTALAAIGSVIILTAAAGAFAAGRLTAESTDTQFATASSAPSDPSDTIDAQKPLEWEVIESLGGTWPVSLIEYRGSLYLFARTENDVVAPTRGSGLEAWTSDDGWSWAPLGTVIPPPHHVTSVVATPQGMAALGNNETGDAPSVWVSSNGSEWSSSDLPTEVSSKPGPWRTWLTAVGGTEDLMVVFGMTQFDAEGLIFDALPDGLTPEGATYPYGMGWGGPPFEVTIHGPFGITVFSLAAEDLGLSEEEVAMLTQEGQMGFDDTVVWRSSDGETWVSSEMNASGIHYVSTTPDGDLMAAGHNVGETAQWTSKDGIEWERQATPGGVYQVIPWRGGLVGVRERSSGTELAYSADGLQWEPLDIDGLPTETLTWGYGPVSAGEAGIAAAAHGFARFGVYTPGSVVLAKDGYTLTVDQTYGSLVLSEGETDVIRLPLHGGQPPEEVAVDFTAQTVTFLDPETSGELVTFTFDELDQAEQETYRGMDRGNQTEVLLLSTDGVEWGVHDLNETVGSSWSIAQLHVTSDGVVAAIADHTSAFIWPYRPPEVQIWFAPFP